MSEEYQILNNRLIKLLDRGLSSELGEDDSLAIKEDLAELLLEMEEDWASDLYETGVRFRQWLDDWDIRQKDPEYNELTTKRLMEWYLVRTKPLRDYLV